MAYLTNKLIKYRLANSQGVLGEVQEGLVTGYDDNGTMFINAKPVRCETVHISEVHDVEEIPSLMGSAPALPAEKTIEFVPPPVESEERETRRLSENPVSPATRRRYGRKGAPDHGAAAAGPDEYAPPGGE